jgi:hypothetical protein
VLLGASEYKASGRRLNDHVRWRWYGGQARRKRAYIVGGYSRWREYIKRRHNERIRLRNRLIGSDGEGAKRVLRS